MSLALVAYGSSDESESSDAEDSKEEQGPSVKSAAFDNSHGTSRFETQSNGVQDGAIGGNDDKTADRTTWNGKIIFIILTSL